MADKEPFGNSEQLNDTISRQAAIDALDEIEAEVADGYGYQYAKWREYFVEMPSAHPEIIRCKDCKYHHYEGDIPYCANIDYGYGWKDNDFCSKAERRGEQDG